MAPYDTGFETIAGITAALHHTLERSQRSGLRPSPILLENFPIPYLQTQKSGAPQPIRTVYISSGFVVLLNFISHAKAIDGLSRGFLTKSLSNLSTDVQDGRLPGLPAEAARNARSFETMNRQASYFNQMAGALVAVDMAHFSLGHYQKYAGQLTGNHSAPLNSLVTLAEWREAVMLGASRALDCGLAVDGLKLIFESIHKIPGRQSWSLFFMPEEADAREISRISRELDQMQNRALLSSVH